MEEFQQTLFKYQIEVEQSEADKNYLDERIEQREGMLAELKAEIDALERERVLDTDKCYEIDNEL